MRILRLPRASYLRVKPWITKTLNGELCNVPHDTPTFGAMSRTARARNASGYFLGMIQSSQQQIGTKPRTVHQCTGANNATTDDPGTARSPGSVAAGVS